MNQSLVLQIKYPIRMCLGTQNPLQNHLQKELEHKGMVFFTWCHKPWQTSIIHLARWSTCRWVGWKSRMQQSSSYSASIGGRRNLVGYLVGLVIRFISDLWIISTNPSVYIYMYIWSNYSDLTRPHPKWWFSKGIPLISGKSRLVKYYNLARYMGVSKNMGKPPKSSILIGFSIINHPFLGYHYLWKHPYHSTME